MKFHELLFTFGFLMLFSAFSYSQTTINPANPSSATADSLHRFISIVGKDSVLKFMDKRINLAVGAVKEWSIEMSNVKMAMIYALVAEHFRLDTLQIEFNKSTLNGEFYKLYGKYYGSYKRVGDTIAVLSKMGTNLNEMFLKNYNDPIARRAAIYFCNNIKFSQSSLDVLYNKAITESGKDVFENYYLFIELYKSACPSGTISKELLIKYESWLNNYLLTLSVKDSEEIPVELSNLSYTYRKFAFNLYAQTADLKSFGKEFAFLTSSQLNSGGFPGIS